MIRSAELIRFDKLATSGRNKPLRVAVETNDGAEHEVVMKPAGWKELTIKSVVLEAIASAVAGLVEAPVCEPFFVNCAPEMIAAIQDADIQNKLQQCAWPAFGSKHAGKQWRLWTTGDLITPERKKNALSIFALDAFIDNPDRRWKNPNLLVKDSALRAIDHELAFGFTELIVKPAPPWEENSLEWLTAGDQENVLHGPLKKAENLDFHTVQTAWAGLADEDLNAILECLPEAWGSVAPLANTVIERVKDVRDNIDACIDELKRVLL